MPLMTGYVRFCGQIVLSLVGQELQKQTKKLRRLLQTARIKEAEQTLNEMLHLSQSGDDPIGLGKAVIDLYESEVRLPTALPRRR